MRILLGLWLVWVGIAALYLTVEVVMRGLDDTGVFALIFPALFTLFWVAFYKSKKAQRWFNSYRVP